MPTCLAFLMEGVEELEFIAPVDIMRRGGVEVTVASLGSELKNTGRSKVSLDADVTLDSVKDQEFDALFLPGGPGTKLLREDSRVLELVKKHAGSGKVIGAICAAPTVLKEAGVLDGKRYTAHHSVKEALPDILPDMVVREENIITSRGAGTAIHFGLALVEQLIDHDKSDEVAHAICFD